MHSPPDVASPALVPYSSRPAPPKSTRGALLFIVAPTGSLKQANTRRPAENRGTATRVPDSRALNEADNERVAAATTWTAVFSYLSMPGLHESPNVRVCRRTARCARLDCAEQRVLNLVWGRQVDGGVT